MGEALDKLGDKVAGQQGGFLALVVLGELTPGLVQQLGASRLTYQSSTEPYQEDGLFPLLGGLRSLILGFVWQLGTGRSTYESGTKPCLLGGLSGLILKLAKQLGASRKKKCRTPITGSLIMMPTLHVKLKVVNDKVLANHSNTSKFITGPVNNFGYSCIHQVCCKLNNAKTELVSGVNLVYREYFLTLLEFNPCDERIKLRRQCWYQDVPGEMNKW